MYVLALIVIIMAKIANMSGMSGFLWGVMTLGLALGLNELIGFMIWSAPLAAFLVYIPLLVISIKQGPQ
jgi:hypothetical protein